MTSVSAGHIIQTPTQPEGSGRPQRESNPGPPHQESRSLPQSYRAPRERERERERERGREGGRDRDRETERDRQTDRQTERGRDRETERHIERGGGEAKEKEGQLEKKHNMFHNINIICWQYIIGKWRKIEKFHTMVSNTSNYVANLFF